METVDLLESPGFINHFHNEEVRTECKARFYKSLEDAITKSGGNLPTFKLTPQTKLSDIADILAQNGVRFCFNNAEIFGEVSRRLAAQFHEEQED